MCSSDLNIMSLFDPRRREHEHAAIEKLRRIEEKSYFSVLTLTEIESGILKLRREEKDKRADQLADFRDGLLRGWADRILPVTPGVALDVARISPARKTRCGGADRSHHRCNCRVSKFDRHNAEWSPFFADWRSLP